jgi:hypothetical protein
MTKPPSPHNDARRERLSAALRENLKRRKAQERSRKEAQAARREGAEDADISATGENGETRDGS